jgi:enoyl-CoA hydratase/carnithine racemase
MSAAGWETVTLTVDGPIAIVTLNRPDVINAYNIQMRDDLWDVLGAVDDMPGVGCLVLRGAGERGFCSGADLTEFGTAPSPSTARSVRWERDLFGRLAALRPATIAVLHGHVIGSGLELAMLCDIRIAADDCRFQMPETAYGMIPAATGTQSLPRLIRTGRALDLVMTGRPLDAGQALRAGLVQRVCSPDALDRESARLAVRLAELGADHVALVRRLAAAAHDLPLGEALRTESIAVEVGGLS